MKSDVIMKLECGVDLKLKDAYYVTECMQNPICTLNLERYNPEVSVNYTRKHATIFNFARWFKAPN